MPKKNRFLHDPDYTADYVQLMFSLWQWQSFLKLPRLDFSVQVRISARFDLNYPIAKVSCVVRELVPSLDPVYPSFLS